MARKNINAGTAKPRRPEVRSEDYSGVRHVMSKKALAALIAEVRNEWKGIA